MPAFVVVCSLPVCEMLLYLCLSRGHRPPTADIRGHRASTMSVATSHRIFSCVPSICPRRIDRESEAPFRPSPISLRYFFIQVWQSRPLLEWPRANKLSSVAAIHSVAFIHTPHMLQPVAKRRKFLHHICLVLPVCACPLPLEISFTLSFPFAQYISFLHVLHRPCPSSFRALSRFLHGQGLYLSAQPGVFFRHVSFFFCIGRRFAVFTLIDDRFSIHAFAERSRQTPARRNSLPLVIVRASC
mmetsp:Transcript_14290/g.34052  ORF Transcript_14290/g.34052 Transcript_14290/m.34052 type:complete len:243 (-) Transcript_14290:1288-2016(-)